MKKPPPLKLPIAQVYLAKLLARPALNFKLDPESLLSVQVADRLRFYSSAQALRGIWFKIANERKCSRMMGAILKAMGVIPGVPDFALMGPWGGGVIELKIEKGGNPQKQLSEHQEYFQYWCQVENVKHAICRSIPDVEATLKAWGALV